MPTFGLVGHSFRLSVGGLKENMTVMTIALRALPAHAVYSVACSGPRDRRLSAMTTLTKFCLADCTVPPVDIGKLAERH